MRHLVEYLRESAIKRLKDYSPIDYACPSSVEAEIFRDLRKRGIIRDSDMDDALKESVTNIARKSYNQILMGYPPDHAGMPEYLAYAIKNKVLSKAEIDKIKFDHGENAETFVQIYGKEDLISWLSERVLNAPIDGMLDRCEFIPCADGGPCTACC